MLSRALLATPLTSKWEESEEEEAEEDEEEEEEMLKSKHFARSPQKLKNEVS